MSTPIAEITLIDGPDVGKAKDPNTITFGRFLAYGVILLPVVVAGAFFGITYLLHMCVLAGGPVEVMIGFIVGGGLIPLYAIYQMKRPDNDYLWRFLVWYYRRVVVRQAQNRTDALFDPVGPGVMYTEMIPRKAWPDLEKHRAICEGGLLLIDEERGALLYEGDRYRYVIPFGAIDEWQFEEIPMNGLYRGTTAGFYAVVLSVDVGKRIVELPLCPFTGTEGTNRWERATTLYDAITAVMQPYEAQTRR